VKKITVIPAVLIVIVWSLSALPSFTGCQQAVTTVLVASGPSNLYSGASATIETQMYQLKSGAHLSYAGDAITISTSGPLTFVKGSTVYDSIGHSSSTVTAETVQVDTKATVYAQASTGPRDSVVITIHPPIGTATFRGLSGQQTITIYTSAYTDTNHLLVYDYNIMSGPPGPNGGTISAFTATFGVPLKSFRQLSSSPPDFGSITNKNQSQVWYVMDLPDSIHGYWSQIKVEAITDGAPGGTASFSFGFASAGPNPVVITVAGPKP
jgi:hypothetical protein